MIDRIGWMLEGVRKGDGWDKRGDGWDAGGGDAAAGGGGTNTARVGIDPVRSDR